MGQSKLKALISTMALQRVTAMEALNTDRQVQKCNSELLKVLMILDLVIVVLLLLRKIKKSIFCWGQPFSNMVKVKLFLADTKSYVSLNLNQSAGNTDLFKLIGELFIRQCCPKEKLVMGYVRNKMGEHLHNAKQQGNTSAHHTSSATHPQIES